MIRSKLAKDSRREQTVWISVTLEGTPSLTPFQLFCNELGHSQIMTPVSDSTWSATLQLHAELKEIADMLSGEIGTKMYLSGKVSLWGCVCVWERDWVTVHFVCVPFLIYAFIYQWMLRLFPCLGCCKQCCNEHWDACISSNHVFLWIYAQGWGCRVIW